VRQQAQAFARLPRRFCFSFKRRVSPFNKRAKSEAIGLVSFWTPTPPLKLIVEVKLRACREARELGEFRKRWEPALWVRLWVPLVSTPTHSRYFHSALRRDPQGPATTATFCLSSGASRRTVGHGIGFDQQKLARARNGLVNGLCRVDPDRVRKVRGFRETGPESGPYNRASEAECGSSWGRLVNLARSTLSSAVHIKTTGRAPARRASRRNAARSSGRP
jgi:hypothetical protein